MELALKAQEEWRANAALKPYYHETGIIRPCDGSGTAIINNYETLLGKGNSPAKLLDIDDVKARFDGIFRGGNWTKVANGVCSPRAGLVDVADALRAVIEAAVDLGTHYMRAIVIKVNISPGGACTGVVTDAGDRLRAEHALFCTGAHTAWLLAESGPDRLEIRVGDRTVAAGSVMSVHQPRDDQFSKFNSAPTILQLLGDYPGITALRPFSLKETRPAVGLKYS